jgi:hypothetical protein
LCRRYGWIVVAASWRVAGPDDEAVHGGRMLMIILIVLLVLALGGGGWGYSRYGFVGWSPAGLILLVLLIMLLTGNLHW